MTFGFNSKFLFVVIICVVLFEICSLYVYVIFRWSFLSRLKVSYDWVDEVGRSYNNYTSLVTHGVFSDIHGGICRGLLVDGSRDPFLWNRFLIVT